MSEVLDAPALAIRDVLAVHDVFRTALAAAPQLVGGVQTPDSDRAAVVAMYYAHILALLHVHHDLEEEYLWGRLRARLWPDPQWERHWIPPMTAWTLGPRSPASTGAYRWPWH